MWWTFKYTDKERLALVLGPDPRCEKNLLCLTPDGVRTFKRELMRNINDESVLYA